MEEDARVEVVLVFDLVRFFVVTISASACAYNMIFLIMRFVVVEGEWNEGG